MEPDDSNLSLRFGEHEFEVYISDGDSNIFPTVSNSGTWEPHVEDVVLSIPNTEDALIVDVGANVGLLTLLFSSHFSGGRVIAIEPDPKNLDFLYKNLKKNKIQNVEVKEFAASNSNGNGVLFQSHGDSFVQPKDALTANLLSENSTVPISKMKLDSILQEVNGVISLLKVDVESHELDLFSGAQQTIERSDNIIVEFGVHKVSERIGEVTAQKAYAGLFSELERELGFAYFISRNNGLVRATVEDFLSLAVADGNYNGDYLFTRKSRTSKSPLAFLSEKILELQRENQFRIDELANIRTSPKQ